MEQMEYRMYDPETGQLRTADGVSTREYVRRVRGMTVEQFERRFGGPDSEYRETDIRFYKFKLLAVKEVH